jgi:hypothetical protein
MEEDFRSAAAARDLFQNRLNDAEEQRTKLEKEVAALRIVVKERNELRKQVAERTKERDTLQGQYDHFRKGLRDLLGQAESALTPPGTQPVTAVLPSSVDETRFDHGLAFE